MDLGKIKEIVNSDYPDNVKESDLIKVLAEDKAVIPIILQILQVERKENEKLIDEANLEISRALVAFVEGEKVVEKSFVISKIKEHFIKWQHRVKCCFKFNDLP